MRVVTPIVEGDGEVAALPILLRRIGAWLSPGVPVTVAQPIRVRRDRFLNREEEFRRHLLLAAAKAGEDGWILVLLDADDDCPAELGPRILERARRIVAHRSVSVVLANREYEAWFLASAESLNGQRGFRFEKTADFEPERVRNAKGWIGERMAGAKYRETIDQPAFSAIRDLTHAFQLRVCELTCCAPRSRRRVLVRSSPISRICLVAHCAAPCARGCSRRFLHNLSAVLFASCVGTGRSRSDDGVPQRPRGDQRRRYRRWSGQSAIEGLLRQLESCGGPRYLASRVW